MAKAKRETTLTRSQVRQLDQTAIRDFQVPGIVLMENAGRGVAEMLLELGVRGPVVIVCGRGNNGGDGLVVARHLDLHGVAVDVWLVGSTDSWPPDAATNLQIVRQSRLSLRQYTAVAEPAFCAALAAADWIVDALLGTGAVGAPRPPFDRVIRQMNATPGKRLAIDLPSGLDCDTGQLSDPTFQAHHTCTFVAAKPGLQMAAAQSVVGELHIVNIGAPRLLLEQFFERSAGEAAS